MNAGQHITYSNNGGIYHTSIKQDDKKLLLQQQQHRDDDDDDDDDDEIMHCISSSSSLTKRPYRCHACCKSFSRPSALKTHSYTHTGEKPFECTVDNCDKKFSVISNLRRHLKTHRKSPMKTGPRLPAIERLRKLQALMSKVQAATNMDCTADHPTLNLVIQEPASVWKNFVASNQHHQQQPPCTIYFPQPPPTASAVNARIFVDSFSYYP